MALFSIVDLSGSDGQQNFAFSFGYLAQTHISVFIDSVVLVAGSAYTFLTAQTIRLNVGLSGPHVVRIQRTTPKDQQLVVFNNGSVLGQTDLNVSELQLLYIAQETTDGTTTGLNTGVTFQWDALGKQIINLAPPTLNTDAVNKDYADTQSGTAAQAAAVAAATAQAAAALQVKNDILALPLVNVTPYVQSIFDDPDSATARQTLQIPTASEVWSNKNFSGAVATADPVVPLGLTTKQYADKIAILSAMLF